MLIRYYTFQLETEDRAIAQKAADLIDTVFSHPVIPGARVRSVKLLSTESDLPDEVASAISPAPFEIAVELEEQAPGRENETAAEIVSELDKHGIKSRLHYIGSDSNGPPFTAKIRVTSAMTASLEMVPVELERLRLWIDPGDAPPEVVADVLRALSDLHAAAGGKGLHFVVDEDESYIVASAEEVL